MGSLKELADEYLQNAADMEKRIRELESQLKHTRQLESQRKLRRRINTLHVIVCESRRIAFELEHYYDKPEEKAYEPKPKRKRGRPRKRYSGTGYGIAAPAAVEHGTGADAEAVSGIRTVLSRRNAAEGNRG